MSFVKRFVLLTACLVMINACTSAGIAIANAPRFFFDGQIKRDIVYDDQTHQKLDLYIPATDAAMQMPVIVFYYGGRWTQGTKEDYAFVGTALAKKGFIVAIPDYRKYPTVTFPAFVKDGAQAMSWVHGHIGNYGGLADKLFLAGHSSGAHIASLLVADESYLQPEIYAAIKGFAGLAGPYAFTPKADDLKAIFGPPSRYPQMQATSFIDGDEAPMLLLYGAQDESVGLFNLNRLQQKINEEGGQVTTKIYPDLDHVSIIGSLSWFWRYKASVLEDITAFFNAQ